MSSRPILALCGAALLLVPGLATAQTAPAPSAPAPEESSVVTLSPFEVTEDRDQGY